eukprot:392592_1
MNHLNLLLYLLAGIVSSRQILLEDIGSSSLTLNESASYLISCTSTISCWKSQILLRQNVRDITIICDGISACNMMTLLSSNQLNSNINIQCNAMSSCKSLHLQSPAINNNNISIQCNEKSSCQSMQIESQYTSSNIQIICNADFSCRYGEFYIHNLSNYNNSNFFIQCIGLQSCSQMNINISTASDNLTHPTNSHNPTILKGLINNHTNIHILCIGRYSCWLSNINVVHHSLLYSTNIGCISEDYSCSMKLNVNTYIDSNIFSNAILVDNKIGNVDITCFKDSSCYDATFGINHYDLFSISQGNIGYFSFKMIEGQSSSKMVFNINNIHTVHNFYSTSNAVLNLFNTNDLIFKFYDYSSAVTIYVDNSQIDPNSYNSVDIVCEGDDSCNAADIAVIFNQNGINNNFTLKCIHNGGCDFMHINVSYANSINAHCSSAAKSVSDACRNVELYGLISSFNSIQVTCSECDDSTFLFDIFNDYIICNNDGILLQCSERESCDNTNFEINFYDIDQITNNNNCSVDIIIRADENVNIYINDHSNSSNVAPNHHLFLIPNIGAGPFTLTTYFIDHTIFCERGCGTMAITANNAEYFDLYCQTYGCWGSLIEINMYSSLLNINLINISCFGEYACREAEFMISLMNNNSEIYFNCIGQDSCLFAEISYSDGSKCIYNSDNECVAVSQSSLTQKQNVEDDATNNNKDEDIEVNSWIIICLCLIVSLLAFGTFIYCYTKNKNTGNVKNNKKREKMKYQTTKQMESDEEETE